MQALALALLLAQAKPLAVELKGGVAEDSQGQLVELRPGDCLVPQTRCVEYVSQAQGCFAERDALKSAPPIGPVFWVLLVVGLASFGAGAAFAQAIGPQ